MSEPGPVGCDPDGRCITCSDAADPLRVLESRPDGLALCVDDHGVASEVETALVGPVSPGDALLVHAGVALLRVEPEEESAA